MYFAHGDINGYDFWGEAAVSPLEPSLRRRPLAAPSSASSTKCVAVPTPAALRAEFDLVTSDGQVIAAETQTLHVSRAMSRRGSSIASLRSAPTMDR